MKLIPGEKKALRNKEDELGRRLTKQERKQLHKKAKRTFIVKTIFGIGATAAIFAGGAKLLESGKAESSKSQSETNIEETNIKEIYKVDLEQLETQAKKEIDQLETQEDVLKFIKDRYIESYEQQTGDTTLTTQDIQIIISHENYVYIDEGTGEIITHGDKPYETVESLEENGVRYSTQNDEIRTYKVLKQDEENKDNNEIIDCITIEIGGRIRVIPGENYNQMKDYKSVLAEMSQEEWKVISTALDYHTNFDNDKEGEKEKFKNRLIEALENEQKAKEQHAKEANKQIGDEGIEI